MAMMTMIDDSNKNNNNNDINAKNSKKHSININYDRILKGDFLA